MKWTVQTLGRVVDDEIADLPPDLGARLLDLFDNIELLGLELLREPHVKPVEGKLWELRIKGREGIARGLDVTVTGRVVVVLHVFEKKSQKLPHRALELARQRMKKVLK